MHAPDMVFENHTAGEQAQGEQALAHIAGIFESWPDLEFQTQTALCARGPGGAGVDRPGNPCEGAQPG